VYAMYHNMVCSQAGIGTNENVLQNEIKLR